MTRGRDSNTAHLVAEDLDDARQQWVRTFGRDRADLGPSHAADLAAEEAAKYEMYDNSRYERPHEEPKPASRRHHEPTPNYYKPPDRGPGISF
jgi:hypothetical protein